jgi:DNA integrity scanning protein DisA with diadenylate cyclase activity
MCFVWISEQTVIISLYSTNLSVFITEADCLLRGTNWVFKLDRYTLVLKRVNYIFCLKY